MCPISELLEAFSQFTATAHWDRSLIQKDFVSLWHVLTEFQGEDGPLFVEGP